MSRSITLHARWQRFVECVLLPVMSVLLPWPACWRLFAQIAVRSEPFADVTESALREMAARVACPDVSAWRLRHRLTRMVDQVDAALSYFRSDRWIERNLVVEGEIPTRGPCLFVGFHYGVGFWVLRYLRAKGMPVSFLSRRIVPEEFPGACACYVFERFRMRQVARAGGGPVVYLGGSVGRMREIFQAGGSVVGLVDVPPEGNEDRRFLSLLGCRASFPTGLLDLAEAEGVQVVAYVCRLDPATGRRCLSFHSPSMQEPDRLAWLARLLEAAIRSDSASWHLWGEFPRFLRETRS
jgi:phosphatidylinositol dimannoside acyltransferase